MKNKLIIALLASFFFLPNLRAQDCQALLEKFRKDNLALSNSVNELDLSNAKLVAQLKVRQDSLIKLTMKIMNLERQVAKLKIQLVNYANELAIKNSEIGRLKERQRKIEEDKKRQSVLTDSQIAALNSDLKQTKNELLIATNNLIAAEKRNDTLAVSIKDKDIDLEVYDRVFKAYASRSRDYVHIKEQEIVFEDKIFKYNQILFVLKFAGGQTEYSPTKEDKEKIERLVQLVSRYDSKVKIQMIIGSEQDHEPYRKLREASVKRIFYSFDAPFNLTDKNFSSRLKTTTENYDVAVLIAKS